MTYEHKIKNKVATISAELRSQRLFSSSYILDRLLVKNVHQEELLTALRSKYGLWRNMNTENTKRHLRYVMQDLRMRWHAPILAGKNGYFIPRTEEEMARHIEKMTLNIKRQTKSMFATLEAVKIACNVNDKML